MLEEATFVVGVGLLVYRFDRTLTNLGPPRSPTGMSFVLAGNRFVASDAFNGGTNILTALTVSFIGPTTLPEGAYYTPPPFVWSGTDGSYVERIDGFPLTVL